MFDDGLTQPRAHQLPALDTQYLEPRKKHKKKRRKHRHREPEPEFTGYAEVTPPDDEELVVVPGKSRQNYYE